MKTIKYIALLFSLIAVSLYGQNNNVPLPKIIPKSPEVAGIERYGEYPVSEYTGIPSINIPLYTIKVKDFEFPISLDYHATGIPVTQEATWVGLGWNLLAGGCISTIPVGVVDGINNTFAQRSDWVKILNYQSGAFPNGMARRFIEDGKRIWNCSAASSSTEIFTQTPDAILVEGMKGSGERDIFRVSLPGGNAFNICIEPLDKKFVYNGEKNKFMIVFNGLSLWTLIDEYGYIYYFSDMESYKSSSSVSETATWYLTKIMYNGQTLIEINYESAYVTYLPQISEYYSCKMIGNTPNPITPERNYSFYSYFKQLYIKSIVSPMDSVVFTTKATQRLDLRNAKILDKILIYERSTKAEIKRYEFEHNYFMGQSQGAETTSSSLDYVTKRLQLTKLTEKKGSDQIKGSYQFAYNTIALPYKTSFSQDFWGFYNGWDNSTGGVPIIASQYGDESLYSRYPVAEIKNCTYSQLTSAAASVGLDLNNLAKKMAPTTDDMTKVNNLRTITALKDAHVTTFWYKPLVGIIQVRDPSGKDIYFEYDSFNRLKNSYIMESGAKKIVEGYEYKYLIEQ